MLWVWRVTSKDPFQPPATIRTWVLNWPYYLWGAESRCSRPKVEHCLTEALLDYALQPPRLCLLSGDLSRTDPWFNIHIFNWRQRKFALLELDPIYTSINKFKAVLLWITYTSLKVLAAIKSAHPQSLILMECSYKLSELFLFINLENCKKITRLRNSFRLWTTSRKGDAHIFFGTLLRLLVEELPTKWEHRMIKLLSQLPEFPQGILFAHGTRIQKKGYRWGLNFPPLSPLLDSTPAPRSQLCLTVKLPGFNLGQLKKPPPIRCLPSATRMATGAMS